MNRFKRSYDIHVSKQHGIILLLHIPVNNRTQGPKSNISSNNNNNTNLRCVSVIWILRHEAMWRGGKHENEHINTESTYTMFFRWNIVWQTLRNHSNNERNGMKNPQTFVETNEKLVKKSGSRLSFLVNFSETYCYVDEIYERNLAKNGGVGEWVSDTESRRNVSFATSFTFYSPWTVAIFSACRGSKRQSFHNDASVLNICLCTSFGIVLQRR